MSKLSTENNKTEKQNTEKQTPNTKYALECVGLNKRIGRNQVLKNVNLTIEKGHIAGLFGPDGAGKTTFSKIICNLTPKSSGKILVNGKSMDVKDVSYLPEYPFVNSKQRVGDLLEMYRSFYEDFNVKRAISAFKRIEVSLNDKFCYLSRSSIQKVETVLVMSRRAKLYILDEPIASVEPKSRDFIIKTIISSCDGDSGVLINSSIASQLEKIVDEVHIIHKGEIKLSSTADDIMRDYGKTVSGFYREAFRC
jgi:ABC-2 type transport system ATP-binding protein